MAYGSRSKAVTVANAYGHGSTAFATSGREEKYGAMANALFDLDVGSPYIYPYIGVGAGYARIDQRLAYALPPYVGKFDGNDNGFRLSGDRRSVVPGATGGRPVARRGVSLTTPSPAITATRNSSRLRRVQASSRHGAITTMG